MPLSCARASPPFRPMSVAPPWLEAQRVRRGPAGELEQLLVLETGKPLVDCRVEVDRTLLTLTTAAEEVGRLHGETVPLDLLPSGEGLLGFWTRQPIGVVVGIAGYNYPLLLASHKLAPALGGRLPGHRQAGPADAARDALARPPRARGARRGGGATRAGPARHGRREVGVALTDGPRAWRPCRSRGRPRWDTRSPGTPPRRRSLLELGSNSALVVAEDADLEAAADAVVGGGYYASGQACISVQRVVVVEQVREVFLGALASRIGSVVVGDPEVPRHRVSALIDERSTGRVRSWVESAVAEGATLVHGGDVRDGVMQPTVLLDVPDGQLAWDEEVFGPVVAVRSVASVDEAFEVVNRSRYGLHASVFTASLDTALRAIDRIEAGGVIVNEVPGFRSDVMPYGGVKDSGIGREGPRFAIEELTVTRMAIIRPTTRQRGTAVSE